MVLSFIKKIFGGQETPEPAAKAEKAAPVAGADSDSADVEEFVRFVVTSLVDSPDLVRVETTEKDRVTTVTVACDKPDIGKIIGRNGKTIAAIRALAAGAAGRLGKKVNVEVLG